MNLTPNPAFEWDAPAALRAPRGAAQLVSLDTLFPVKRYALSCQAILFVVVVIALGGAAAIRTVANSGPEAVAQVTGDERALLAKLETLRKGMSPAEVVAVLGEPDEPGPLGLRPSWLVGGNPLNAVVVYFLADGAYRVAWLSLGRFHYERKL